MYELSIFKVKMHNVKIIDNETEYEKNSKPKKQRCSYDGCKKKLSICDIIINKCACGYVFCNNHKMPTSHCCKYEFTDKIDIKAIKDTSCEFTKLIKI